MTGDELKHERTPPQPLLRGIQSAGSGYLHDGERKLALHDHARSISGIDARQGPLNPTSHPGYSVVPDSFSAARLPQIGLSNGFMSAHAVPQLPLPGPSSLVASSPESPLDELKALLPPVKHVTKFCELYHNAYHGLYPVDIGLPHVEQLLLQYIHQSLGDRVVALFETGRSEEFREAAVKIAVLNAGISAGIQVSDVEEPARQAMLQQYVSNTMRLLRLTDASSTPSIAALPALLLVARVVQDELEPILSYVLLGSVQRMTQMHTITAVFTDTSKQAASPEALLRVRLRQEAFLALHLGQSYLLERPSLPDVRGWANVGYLQCLDFLANIAAYCSNENIDRNDSLQNHIEAVQIIASMQHWAIPHLADKTNCRNVHELTEHCTLRIHESLVYIHYCQIIMAACRRLPGHEEEYFKTGDACKNKARECIDTYLEMLQLSVSPLRSWILTLTALRAALVLGVLLAEVAQSVAEAAPDKDRLTRLFHTFMSTPDEAHADRSRWTRRYRVLFERLRDMSEMLGQPEHRAFTMNGSATSPTEPGTAIRQMSRDDRDNIMMPQRMVQHYLALPVKEESGFASLMQSRQNIFDI